MVTDAEARNFGCDLLEHAIQHFAVTAIDRADIAHIEPKPAARDRVHHPTATETADFALAPDAARPAGAGLHQAVVLARIALDQFGKRIGGEQRRVMYLVRKLDRLMAPQQRMGVVSIGENLVFAHCLAPTGSGLKSRIPSPPGVPL